MSSLVIRGTGTQGRKLGEGFLAIEAQNSPTVLMFTIIASKCDIEHYLKQRVTQRGHMTRTILRPTVFVDPLIPNFRGEMFATIIKASLKPSRSLVYLTTSDIEFFGSQAFLHANDLNYYNKAISPAGDNSNFEQLDLIFMDKTKVRAPCIACEADGGYHDEVASLRRNWGYRPSN